MRACARARVFVLALELFRASRKELMVTTSHNGTYYTCISCNFRHSEWRKNAHKVCANLAVFVCISHSSIRHCLFRFPCRHLPNATSWPSNAFHSTHSLHCSAGCAWMSLCLMQLLVGLLTPNRLIHSPSTTEIVYWKCEANTAHLVIYINSVVLSVPSHTHIIVKIKLNMMTVRNDYH